MIHKNIKILTWFNFFTDFKLYAPIAIIYFSQVTGSFAQGMSVFSIAMISSALFELPTGIFSDYLGRRKTMVLGALCAVSYALFYAVGGSFWILAVGAIFEGLSRSFYSGTQEALLHESLAESKNEHEYDEYLGKTSSMFQVALSVSAILGGILAAWSFPLIMWLSVIPQGLCLFLSTRLTEPKVHTRESGNIYGHLKEAMGNFVSNKKLRLLSISSIVGYGLGESGYLFQAAFYNMLWPVWAIGFAKSLSNAGAAFSFYFSGKVIHKFGALKTLFVGNIISDFIGLTGILLANIFSPILMVSTSVFYGVTSVAENSLMQKEFKNAQRATMGSLNAFGGSIFFGIMSFTLGSIADTLNPRNALLIFQILSLPITFLYWMLFRQSKISNLHVQDVS